MTPTLTMTISQRAGAHHLRQRANSKTGARPRRVLLEVPGCDLTRANGEPSQTEQVMVRTSETAVSGASR
jgi:hypothetical protein